MKYLKDFSKLGFGHTVRNISHVHIVPLGAAALHRARNAAGPADDLAGAQTLAVGGLEPAVSASLGGRGRGRNNLF